MGQSRLKTITSSPEALWFGLVGGLAALTHVGSLFICVHFIHISPQYANILAFIFAFMVSFCGHYYLTFKATAKIWHQALWRWFCSSVAGFVLNQLLFLYGLHLFGQDLYLWIWLVVTMLVTILSFLLGKFWAFRINKESA